MGVRVLGDFPVLAGILPVGHDDECSRALRFSFLKVLFSLAAAQSWKCVKGPAGNTRLSLNKCCAPGWMWQQRLAMENRSAAFNVCLQTYGCLWNIYEGSPPFVPSSFLWFFPSFIFVGFTPPAMVPLAGF